MMSTYALTIVILVSCLGVCWAGKFSKFARDKKGFTFDEKVEILRRSNELRRSAGASNMNQLFWHSGLDKIAQDWANNCVYGHNSKRHKRPGFEYRYVGENLYLTNYWSSYTKYLDSWFKEKNNFFPNGTCIPRKMCGHYAQMLWYNTETMACGARYCAPISGSSYMKEAFLVVCDYGPLGNTPGEAIMNIGEPCTECPQGRICVDKLCAPPNCNNVKCQNEGQLVQDVCMCNCTGTGYDGEFCETKVSAESGSGSDSGGGSSGREVRSNVTSIPENVGTCLRNGVAWRSCVYVFLSLFVCFLYY